MRSSFYSSIDSFVPKTPVPTNKPRTDRLPSPNTPKLPSIRPTRPKSRVFPRLVKVNLHSHPFKTSPESHSRTHLFSQRTNHLLRRAIAHSWALSTTKKYSNAIQLFFDFCDIENIPNTLRFPTDEFVLCAFAASGSETSTYSTIRNKITALKAWHNRHDTEWKGGMRLHLVMKGIKKLAPKSPSKALRPPINAKMLSQLIENLDLNNPLDASIAACATVAFWGQCRLGELLPTTSRDFRTSHIPARSHLQRSSRNKHSFILHLPRTKTKDDGEDIVLTNQHGPSDPLKILRNHLHVNQLPRKAPMFTYLSKSGPRSLTRRLFLAKCNKIWCKLGYPRTTGHTFRIGGTTELLLAGVPPDVVKTLGRWTSDSFLRYWRFLDAIAPRYCKKVHAHRLTTRKRKRQDSL